ncbi:MAG: hypothetical protein JWP92_3207 [Caulobacter sp.]|nr:hypothetical protein [Caulobacter sp.]
MNAPIAVIPAQDVLGEGPVWDVDTQRLLWTDIQSRVLRRYDPANGAVETFPAPERIGAIGLLPGEADRVVAAFETGFGLFDLKTGAVDWLARPETEANGRRFNDGRVDRQGRFWAGTMVEDRALRPQATAALWRLDADGAASIQVAGVQIANGLAFSPDGATLYFADSLERRIDAYDLDAATGTLANGRPFAAVEVGGPDGGTVDAEGHVWSARWGAGTVVRHAPDGRVVQTLRLPVSQPTCMAFGGPDLTHLYVTTARDELTPARLAQEPSAGDIFVYEVAVPGLAEARYTGALPTAAALQEDLR